MCSKDEISVVVKSQKVLIGDDLKSASIFINSNGVIVSVSIGCTDNVPEDCKLIDAGELVVMPGIVDAHVHVNEPGRTDWEGYESATRSAAAGGITTIVDMPLNCSPVTTTLSALNEKIPHADRQSNVNIAFWGGIVPGSQNEIKPMLAAGVRGFKCFLIHSGIDEFPHCEETDLRLAYEQLKNTNSVFLFHAEMDCVPDQPDTKEDNMKYSTFLKSRPEIMEVEAIKLIIKLAAEFNVRSHIVHLSAASALPIIREAQNSGIPITVETCHHYLTLNSENIPDGSTEFKCCPPIRDAKNQELLWGGIADGSISMIVSDHSPCTANLKLKDSGDFMAAWGGISGLQLGLSLFWTACSQRGIPLSKLSQLMSLNTAKHAALNNIALIKPGYQADLVIFNPDETLTVTSDSLHHKNKLSAYIGMKLRGVVYKTLLGGQIVYQKEIGFNDKPLGTLFTSSMA